MKRRMLLSIISIASIASIAISLGLFVSLSNKHSVFYTVTFDTKGGSSIDPIQVKLGKKIDQPINPTKTGSNFNSWSYLDKNWDFKKDVVREDMTLVASWNLLEYKINYNFNGGYIEGDYPVSYNIESEFDLTEPVKAGSIFGGWFDENNELVESIEHGMYGELTLTASWIDKLVAETTDDSKGIVLIHQDHFQSDTVTIENVPTNHKYHLFKGWYNEKDELISEDHVFTLTLAKDKTTYIYSKYLDSSEENEWNIEHGVIPSVLSDNNKISYGLYPQDNISDIQLIEKLNSLDKCDFNDLYYYHHEYYVNKKATLAKDSSTSDYLALHSFDNGTEIINGETYWFKLSPIEWRILEYTSNKYYLAAEKLIDVKVFDKGIVRTIDDKQIYPNNYEYSDIRFWLNNDFLNYGFYFGSEFLEKMLVDNSPSTTASPESETDYNDTLDYVTLLSYEEYNSSNYNFSNWILPGIRHFITTDFSRASRATYSTSADISYSGYCWTRSPIVTSSNNGFCVSRNNKNGALNNDYVGWGASCIQPVITVQI